MLAIIATTTATIVVTADSLDAAQDADRDSTIATATTSTIPTRNEKPSCECYMLPLSQFLLLISCSLFHKYGAMLHAVVSPMSLQLHLWSRYSFCILCVQGSRSFTIFANQTNGRGTSSFLANSISSLIAWKLSSLSSSSSSSIGSLSSIVLRPT